MVSVNVIGKGLIPLYFFDSSAEEKSKVETTPKVSHDEPKKKATLSTKKENRT